MMMVCVLPRFHQATSYPRTRRCRFLICDDDGEVVGPGLQLLKPSPELSYTEMTSLHKPFDQEIFLYSVHDREVVDATEVVLA